MPATSPNCGCKKFARIACVGCGCSFSEDINSQFELNNKPSSHRYVLRSNEIDEVGCRVSSMPNGKANAQRSGVSQKKNQLLFPVALAGSNACTPFRKISPFDWHRRSAYPSRIAKYFMYSESTKDLREAPIVSFKKNSSSQVLPYCRKHSSVAGSLRSEMNLSDHSERTEAASLDWPSWFASYLDALSKDSAEIEINVCLCGVFRDKLKILHQLKYEDWGVKEGFSTWISDSSPRDILRWGSTNQESNDIVFRQGAMKLKFDEKLQPSRQNPILDLRWLRHGSIKMSSIKENFSFLQQSLPRASVPTIKMVDDHRNLGKSSLDELLEEVDKSFKSFCSFYRALGPCDREAIFFETLRSQVGVRSPYLSSVAFDALRLNFSAENVMRNYHSDIHLWAPRAVAEGSGSFLRDLLALCEKQCSPNGTTLGDIVPLNPIISEQKSTDDERVSFRNAKKSGESIVSKPWEFESGGSVITRTKRTGMQGNAYFTGSLWGAGIISPWLYYMSVGSVFGCHIEDYAFGSANVIIAPPGSHTWVVWYSVSRDDIGNLHEYLRGLLGDEYSLDCLEKRKLWLDPESVAAWQGYEGQQITVYHHLQGPSEYILTDYGAVHWGVNLGVGWKAAVNFAFRDWRKAAQSIHCVYRNLELSAGVKRNYRCVPDFDMIERKELQSDFRRFKAT